MLVDTRRMMASLKITCGTTSLHEISDLFKLLYIQPQGLLTHLYVGRGVIDILNCLSTTLASPRIPLFITVTSQKVRSVSAPEKKEERMG